MTKKRKTPAELFAEIPDAHEEIYGDYKLSVKRSDIDRVIAYEEISSETLQKFISPSFQDERLSYLKEALPLKDLAEKSCIKGRVDKFTSLSHHIWVAGDKPCDIITYRTPPLAENKYEPNKTRTTVDDPDNGFIKSIRNLDEGAAKSNLPLSDGKFHHILWTNLSIEDLEKNTQLTSLRKIYNLEKASVELPEFVVLNINDVMDKDFSQVQNLANPAAPLPRSVLNGLVEMKTDLLSVRDQLEDMKNNKMFASMSDVIRVIAVKDCGGLYCDVDYNIFDQENVHTEHGKYNLFDILKNYQTVVGKEAAHDFTVCNAFISSAAPHSKVLEEAFKTIKRNITSPDEVDYIKYCANNWTSILFQTGPVALTIGLIKGFGEEDIALNYGSLFYHDFKKTGIPHTPPTPGDVGALGYDTWGGTWVNQSKDYILYTSDGTGITYAEWLATRGEF